MSYLNRCQDSISYLEKDKIQAITLADGAGKDNYAKVGAQHSCKTLAKLLTEHFQELYEMDKSLVQFNVITNIQSELYKLCETYVYHAIWKNAIIDDIKMNVSFEWDTDDSKKLLGEDAIINEIDVVFTKNMQTYFISCKQSKPTKEFLQEIKNFADYFGVDGKICR